MLILPKDVLPTWQMSLKQFTLTVGLLIALAATVIKAQADTGNGSFVTSVTTQSFSSGPEPKFCNSTQDYVHHTRCMECANGQFEPCNTEFHFVRNESCQALSPFGYTVPGCKAVCAEERVNFKCCDGYWGNDCTECPGGSHNPCNGHGTCLPRTGLCICEMGFHGKACELCQNKKKFGPNCSEDCTCAEWECNSGIHGDGSCAHCTCAEWECNSGIHGDGGCAPENPCNSSVLPCGANSYCLQTGPGAHVCLCDEGYGEMSDEGSGFETGTEGDCVPDDPCQIHNGGCDSTQYCMPLGTGKWGCRCKNGYELNPQFTTCSLKDMCTRELCGHFAYCVTKEPLKYSCVCHGNYTWNGQTCSSNLIEVLGDLSAGGDSRFVGTLQYMYNMTSRFYRTLLEKLGPFTLFAPTDDAFRLRFGDRLSELFTDDIKMKKIIRQHVVIGRLTTVHPGNMFTLQGSTASLNYTTENNRKVTRYCLQGSDNGMDVSVITAGDIVASNGIIHIIKSVVGIKDALFDNSKTALNVIEHNHEYETMSRMIWITASSEIFSKPNTTVFLSDNKAWDRLSREERKYLISDPTGQDELRVILKNHVYPGIVDVADLIKRPTIKSYANIKVRVTVGRTGYIGLGDDGAKIRQADIAFSTGLCHRVDQVLVPLYLKPLIKARCENNIPDIIQGRCRDCSIRTCSMLGDVPLQQMKRCTDAYFLNQELGNSSGPHQDAIRESFLRRHPWPKCFETCYRRRKIPGCCAGFYGPNCLPCPRTGRKVCSRKGKCDDGDNGSGNCTCNANFTGLACEQCVPSHNFGPRCDQRCTCQFGKCDHGRTGTGKCQPGTCQRGYTGENCDQKLTPCESNDVCQLHANCYSGSDGKISCYCALGYEEDGDICVRIDFCSRNHCHEQATCSQDASGVIECTCNLGWHGDGFICMPNLPCYNDSHCHGDAVCHNTEPGQFRCVCKTGYLGNGTACEAVDPCTLNNVSCHQIQPAIAGVTAAVVLVLVVLFATVIYKKWKRSPGQTSTSIECNFNYSQIGTGEDGDSMSNITL